MYSYEERLRAVQLYLKLGRRSGATIRRLGYPTKNSLKAWSDESESRGELQTGYRRIQASLNRQPVFVSEKVVQRLMKQEGLHAARPKPRRYRSYVGEISPTPENIINRDFHAAAPNEKWLTDISEFHIPAGKVYLSPMINCFDGMVVSWSIGTNPDAELVNTMPSDVCEGLVPDTAEGAFGIAPLCYLGS